MSKQNETKKKPDTEIKKTPVAKIKDAGENPKDNTKAPGEEKPDTENTFPNG